MHTIRARLTIWYTVSATGIIVAFAVALLFAAQARSLAEVDTQIQAQAALASTLISEIQLDEPVEDPRTQQEVQAATVTLLDRINYYLVVVNPSGQLIYSSPLAAGLGRVDQETLAELATPLPDQERFGQVRLASLGRSTRYVTRPIGPTASKFGGVVVADVPSVSQAFLQQLLVSMMLIAPLIVAASVGVGYWLAGRALGPIEVIIDEVEAITDGRSLHRRLAATAETDEIGRLAATLNAMLARLERNFAALRRFTADASHELKTPLTVVRSGVERALTTPNTPRDILELLEETLIEINRMTEMVDSLLTLARADEGRTMLHRERVDLRAQVEEAFEAAEILAEPAEVSVAMAVPDDPVWLSADRSRIRQLLINLLTNAIKYTPRGGAVRLALEDEGATAVVSVSDTGIGIAAGDLPHIFDRYWRADTARTRTRHAGAGLGLAICKWIVNAHGGTIEAFSRPGRGTTFTVILQKERHEKAATDPLRPASARIS